MPGMCRVQRPQEAGGSVTGVVAPFSMRRHVFGIEKHIAKLAADVDVEVYLISEMRRCRIAAFSPDHDCLCLNFRSELYGSGDDLRRVSNIICSLLGLSGG